MQKNILILTLICLATNASAATQVSIEGDQVRNNTGLSTKTSGGIGGSISQDLGSYFRLGLKFRQEEDHEVGFMEERDQNDKTKKIYYKIDNRIKMGITSLNLFIILYNGEVFTPYVFGGVARIQYDIHKEIDGSVFDDSFYIPSPTGGLGMAFRLSQRFSIKFTYTMRQGILYSDPNDKLTAARTIDFTLEGGLQYSFN